MAGGFIKSRFIDDKACSAVLLTLMKYMSENKITPSRNITAYFTFYEEILHGGSWIPPQTEDLIALDIAPVGPEQTSDEHKATIFAKDSRFPYHLELTRELIDAAERAGINYEVDVFTPGYGPTVTLHCRPGMISATLQSAMAAWLPTAMNGHIWIRCGNCMD